MVLFCEVFILEAEPKDSLISGAFTLVVLFLIISISTQSDHDSNTQWIDRKISTIFFNHFSHYYYDNDYFGRIYQLNKRYASELYPYIPSPFSLIIIQHHCAS